MWQKYVHTKFLHKCEPKLVSKILSDKFLHIWQWYRYYCFLFLKLVKISFFVRKRSAYSDYNFVCVLMSSKSRMQDLVWQPKTGFAMNRIHPYCRFQENWLSAWNRITISTRWWGLEKHLSACPMATLEQRPLLMVHYLTRWKPEEVARELTVVTIRSSEGLRYLHLSKTPVPLCFCYLFHGATFDNTSSLILGTSFTRGAYEKRAVDTYILFFRKVPSFVHFGVCRLGETESLLQYIRMFQCLDLSPCYDNCQLNCALPWKYLGPWLR